MYIARCRSNGEYPATVYINSDNNNYNKSNNGNALCS